MTEEKKKAINKLGKLLLNNGMLIAFVLYLIVFGIFCSSFNSNWFLWLLISCFIGWTSSFFYKKFEAEDEMRIEPVNYDYKDNTPNNWKERWENIGQTMREMSGWIYLRWVLTLSFLAVACYIMHESLSTLWLNENGLGGIFCWFLSVIVIVTLFWATGWLTHQLPYVQSEYKNLFIVSCVGLYLLFDIAAFTFNYFHIYSNFGETQIMAQAVRISEELSKYITPIISSEKQNIDTIEQPKLDRIEAYKKEKRELQERLNGTSSNNTIIPQKIYYENNFSYINPVYIQVKRDIKKLDKKIDDLEITDEDRNSPNKYAIISADKLLHTLDSLIVKFDSAKIANDKAKQRNLKGSIVKAEGELYGKLDSVLQKNSIVIKYHSIINTKTIDQNKALNDLFELLSDEYEANHKKLTLEGEKEVHELLHRESIRSVWLSALIDLAPILLALLVAFPATNSRKRQ
ncbi:MAG: hypothetical protein WCN88_05305 [Candidatus Falkowbacteria bacterium]